MNKKVIVGIWIVFLFTLVNNSYAQSTTGNFDRDGDGVCDWAAGHSNYVDLTSSDLLRYHNCVVTVSGDYCDDTPLDERSSVDKKWDSETSGCSRAEQERYFDYWSINIKGLNPSGVKINWLLDQSNGFYVYQDLAFTPNIVAEQDRGEVKIDNLIFDCQDITNIDSGFRRYASGFRHINVDDDLKETTLRVSLRQFEPEEVESINILESPSDIYRNINDPTYVVKEIEIKCEVRINEYRELEDGRKSRFHEIDEFTFIVPIRPLTIEPPDQALGFAHTLAEQIVDRTDNLISVFDKARKFSEIGCSTSAGLLIVTAPTKAWPSLNFMYEFAVKLWRGTGGANIFSTSSGGGWVGGKAFCRYSACPAEFCPATQGKLHKGMDGEWEGGEGPGSKSIAKVFDDEGIHIQDNIILSVRCGCVTGIQQNLLYINVIFQEWARCLEAASENKEFTSLCEQYLRENVCEFVIGQGKSLIADNILKSAWNKVKEKFRPDPVDTLSTTAPEAEAGLAIRFARGVKETFNTANEVYKEEGLYTVARSHARGTLGYRDIPAEQLICESVFYWQLPEVNLLKTFQSRVGVPWKTSYHTSYSPEIISRDPQGNPVYDLKISWFVLAGQDDFCFRLFLEDENGATKPIPTPDQPGSPTRSTSRKCIDKAGKYNADYIELIDSKDYEKICFYFDKEIPQKQCFQKGFHSSSLEFQNIRLSEDQDDRDGDDLPDWWEVRYNCLPEMRSWVDEIDENGNNKFVRGGVDGNSCLRLLDSGGINKLDPSLKDSDGDGIRDDKENPDGDLYENYYEFDNKLNPNVPGGDETGGGALSECNINFDGFTVISGESLDNVPRFNNGESINLKTESSILAYEDGRELDTNNVVIFAELFKGAEGESLIDSIFVKWNDAVSGVKLFDVSDDMETGNYLLELEVELEKGIIRSKCVDANNDYKRILERKNIVIINNIKGGCVDSDNGNGEIGGVCYDSTGGVKKDSCNNGDLIEWGCREDKCAILDTNCFDTQQCILDAKENGACTDTCSEDRGRGLCIETNLNTGEEVNKYSICSNNEITGYSCQLGKCLEDSELSTACGTQSQCYKKDDEIAAVCVDKCFDNDGGINENQFGAGVAFIYDRLEEFSDGCVDAESEAPKTLAEKFCSNNQLDSRVITCPNRCVPDKILLKYDPLSINKNVDSAKCI